MRRRHYERIAGFAPLRDGRVKLRRNEVLERTELFDLIDRMPMRKAIRS